MYTIIVFLAGFFVAISIIDYKDIEIIKEISNTIEIKNDATELNNIRCRDLTVKQTMEGIKCDSSY